MKTNKLHFLFFFSFVYFVPFSTFAQSLGFSVGTSLMHISKANFNASANLSDLQVAGYNQRLGLGICFEYPLSSRLRLRTEANYFNTGYELRLYYNYDMYKSKGFGFSTIQGTLLAETTILTISAKSYLAAHGGFGIGYTSLNRVKTGLHIGAMANPILPTTFEDNTMLIVNSNASVAAIIGLSFQKISNKGKFLIGANYNRALTASPSTDLKLTMIQRVQNNDQRYTYDQTLYPNLHLLQIYFGYAWFLKRKDKEKTASKRRWFYSFDK
jgi:hypothetical protein